MLRRPYRHKLMIMKNKRYFQERTTKRLTPISQINQNWVHKKHTFEKTHKYSGEPEVVIERLIVQIDEEKSRERIKTKDEPMDFKDFDFSRRRKKG